MSSNKKDLVTKWIPWIWNQKSVSHKQPRWLGKRWDRSRHKLPKPDSQQLFTARFAQDAKTAKILFFIESERTIR